MSDAGAPWAEVSELIDPSLDWSDIEHFVAATDLPVVLKGILTAEDAHRAAACGVAAIVVSNHGGRQLDTVLSGADALPAVVEADSRYRVPSAMSTSKRWILR